MIGKLNSIKSSNKIILVKPGLEGNITKRPTDLLGISIKENFC